MASVLSALPAVLERHELKYLVPYSQVEAISDFISPYCSLDYYSDKAENHFYTVNSLYFDTPTFQFLQQRMYGRDMRFNMRARAYADGDKPPYFLEIKHKTGPIVKKYRATANDEEWPRILADPNYRVSGDDEPKEKRNKELFLRLAMSYSIEPKILTQYRRRAFFSTVDEYARVTMDISMKYRLEDRLILTPNNDMNSYDNQNIYTGNTFHTGESVILELKCNIGQVPMWMLDIIQRFNLKQIGFSKYMNSTMVAREENGYSYMTGDRVGML